MFSLWSGLSKVDYFTIMILSSFLGACIFLVVFKLILGRSFRPTNLHKIRETIAIIKRMTAVSSGTKIVYAFWDSLPVLLLANYVSDAVMGQIVLALRLSERFKGISTSLAKVNMAYLTKKLKQEGASAHAKEFKSNFSILTMLYGCVLIITYLLSDFIIVLVGGPEFSGTGVYLIYTMTMAYMFLQINWIGSGVLYGCFRLDTHS